MRRSCHVLGKASVDHNEISLGFVVIDFLRKVLFQRQPPDTALDLLKRAWGRIENPRNRCILAVARDVHGNSVSATSVDACKWCFIGALIVEKRTQSSFDAALYRLNSASEEIFGAKAATAFQINPDESASRMFRRAIELEANG